MPSKRNHFLSTIVLSVVILAAACQPQATATPAVTLPLTAAMSEVSGTVGAKQPGSAEFSPASAGLELQVNGAVQTGDDGRARLDLSTGTIVRVVPSSIFTLVSNQPTEDALSTGFKLDLGGIFIILKGGNASVTTPSGVASVRGSLLSVYIDPNTGDIIVTCLEGHCGAGNDAGSVEFGGGQAVILFACHAGKCSVPTVGPMTPEQFQWWFDNNPDLFGIPGLSATMTALVPTPTLASTEPAAGLTPTSTQLVAVPATQPPAREECVIITSPSSNAGMNPVGPVHFAWDPKDGASRYVLTIRYPNGASATFYTDGTSVTRYMETLPGGGTYAWDITALNSSGSALCSTSTSSFSKPETFISTPKPRHACTSGQWQFPDKPCFCGGETQNMPPYCFEIPPTGPN